MNKSRFFLPLIVGIVLGIALLALASYVSAQIGGTDDDDRVEDSSNAVAIITNDTVQVQGRLTNASGSPINTSVQVVASIYDAGVGGTLRCTDSDLVIPVNGLFTMVMDFCTADDFNGDQLWLGLKMGTDAEMTPRQEIHAVPYAWGLRPGAIVKGADSYIFIPGSTLVKNLSTDTTRWDIQGNGAARIRRGATAGSKTIFLPIMLPAELYGQTVTLKQMTVYYKVSNSANGFIDRTVMNVMTSADGFVNVVDDSTNRIGTASAQYSLDFTTNNVISSTQGSVIVFFTLSFANDTDYVDIGSIRLRLGHQ
jgi:hypothetical protein